MSASRQIWIAIIVAAALLALATLLWLYLPRPAPAPAPSPPPSPAEPPEPPPPRLDLAAATFADLPGWGDDDPSAALAAFRRSCTVLLRLDADRELGGSGAAGTAGDWHPACRAAAAVPAGDAAAARAFFERRFTPWAAADHDDREGFFTGYFEPTLDGSRRRDARHRFPLYLRPPELVSVDLGEFRDELSGQRIAGRVEGGRLVPFADRAGIEGGALAGRDLELVWVDDPVDAFFLHVQGSGVVRLAEGGELRVGYAAQNGHPYRSIGRELVDRGELALEEVSLQSIRAWLADHREEAADLMAANPSYVFFRRLTTEGPVGSQGVVLTAGRSLAVDRRFHAMGTPIYLAGTAPSPDEGAPDRPLERLLVAQDTGGAITGPLRGDVFWGPGDDAAEVAGRMKHPARVWVLLPRERPAG